MYSLFLPLEIKIEDALNVVVRSHNIKANGWEVFLGFTDKKTCIIHQISHSLKIKNQAQDNPPGPNPMNHTIPVYWYEYYLDKPNWLNDMGDV